MATKPITPIFEPIPAADKWDNDKLYINGGGDQPLTDNIKAITLDTTSAGRTSATLTFSGNSASRDLQTARELLEHAGYADLQISSNSITIPASTQELNISGNGGKIPSRVQFDKDSLPKLMDVLSTDIELARGETIFHVMSKDTATAVTAEDLKFRGVKPSEAGLVNISTEKPDASWYRERGISGQDLGTVDVQIKTGPVSAISENTRISELGGVVRAEVSTRIDLRDPYQANATVKALADKGIEANITYGDPSISTNIGMGAEGTEQLTQAQKLLKEAGIKASAYPAKEGKPAHFYFANEQDASAAESLLKSRMPSIEPKSDPLATRVTAISTGDEVTAALSKAKIIPSYIADEVGEAAAKAHPGQIEINNGIKAQSLKLSEAPTVPPVDVPAPPPVEPPAAGEVVDTAARDAANATRNRLIARDGMAGRFDSSMMSRSGGRGPGGMRNMSAFRGDFQAPDAHRPLQPLKPAADVPLPDMAVDPVIAKAGSLADPIVKAPVTADIVPPLDLPPVAGELAGGDLLSAGGVGRFAGLGGTIGKVGGVVGMAAIPGVIGLATRKDGENIGDAVGRGYSDTIKGMVMTPLAAAERGDKLGYAAGIVDISGIPASAILNEVRIEKAAADLPQVQVDRFLPQIKGNENLGSSSPELNRISALLAAKNDNYGFAVYNQDGNFVGMSKENSMPFDQAVENNRFSKSDHPIFTYTKPATADDAKLLDGMIDKEVRRYMAMGGNPETMHETLDPAYARERRFERLRNLVGDDTYGPGSNVEAITGAAELEQFRNGIRAQKDGTLEGKEALMKIADAYYAQYPDDPQTALRFANRSYNRGSSLGATVPNTDQLVAAGFGPLMGLSGKPEEAGADKAKFDKFIMKDDLYKKLNPNAEFTISTDVILAALPAAQQAQVMAERQRLETVAASVTPSPTPAPVVAAAPVEPPTEEIIVTGSRFKRGVGEKEIPESVRKLVDSAGLTNWMDADGDGKISNREYHQRMDQAGVEVAYDKARATDVNANLPKLQNAASQDRSGGRSA